MSQFESTHVSSSDYFLQTNSHRLLTDSAVSSSPRTVDNFELVTGQLTGPASEHGGVESGTLPHNTPGLDAGREQAPFIEIPPLSHETEPLGTQPSHLEPAPALPIENSGPDSSLGPVGPTGGEGEPNKEEIVVPYQPRESVNSQMNGIVHSTATLAALWKANQQGNLASERRLAALTDDPLRLAGKDSYNWFLKARSGIVDPVESLKLEADEKLGKLVQKKPHHFVTYRAANGELTAVPNLDLKGLSPGNLRVYNNSAELGDLRQKLELKTDSLQAIRNRPTLAQLNQDKLLGKYKIMDRAMAYDEAAQELVEKADLRQSKLIQGFKQNLWKNAAVLASSFAINRVVDSTLLRGSRTGFFTYSADILSPFIVVTSRQPLVKLGVITGSHLLGKVLDNKDVQPDHVQD
ncbi:MAG: hypothetical protein SFV17_12770 [Candidatus Obscuribacter sp.]|nr:hypothetical protein [Candidatus Obscuribacter sp.]